MHWIPNFVLDDENFGATTQGNFLCVCPVQTLQLRQRVWPGFVWPVCYTIIFSLVKACMGHSVVMHDKTRFLNCLLNGCEGQQINNFFG